MNAAEWCSSTIEELHSAPLWSWTCTDFHIFICEVKKLILSNQSCHHYHILYLQLWICECNILIFGTKTTLFFQQNILIFGCLFQVSMCILLSGFGLLALTCFFHIPPGQAFGKPLQSTDRLVQFRWVVSPPASSSINTQVSGCSLVAECTQLPDTTKKYLKILQTVLMLRFWPM